MRSKLVACALALAVAGCTEGSFSNRASLPLRMVDQQTLPVILPSGTGTIQVLSGVLVGSRIVDGCTWTVNFGDGTSRTGTVAECRIPDSDIFDVTVDLGGPPGPSGSHVYRFTI